MLGEVSMINIFKLNLVVKKQCTGTQTRLISSSIDPQKMEPQLSKS